MCLYVKLRNFYEKTLKIFLLLAVLLFCVCSSDSCSATEKTYLVTETQLTQLETNLATLKTQNQTLQAQLQISQTQVQISQTQVQTLQKQSEILQTQSTMLQTQVNNLTQSLERAKTLLNKYESKENKSYTIGVGGGSNGLGLYASKDKTWMYLDKDTATIGWQINF